MLGWRQKQASFVISLAAMLGAFASGALLVASCTTDVYSTSTDVNGGDASVTGGLGQPCYPNLTCSPPYRCDTAAVCIVVASTDAATFGEGGSQVTLDGSSSSITCPQFVEADDIPPYVPPGTAQALGSCTAADVSAFATAYDNTKATIEDWYNSISSPCQSCVFSGLNDPHWGLLVLAPNLQSGLQQTPDSYEFLNIGPCFQNGPGGTAACGQAAENFQNCQGIACPAGFCDSTPNCENLAQNDECKSYFAQFQSMCGSALSGLVTYCGGKDQEGTLLDQISAVCGPASDDGGS